jgi:hypothetical protein
MNVSSVSNTYVSTSTQALQRTPEAAEVKKAGSDNDGDADDGGGIKAVKPPAAPTVNMNSQKIGQVINVTA